MGIYVYNHIVIIIRATYLRVSGKSLINLNRTKSDTGRLVEYTKALGRRILKELGKITL